MSCRRRIPGPGGYPSDTLKALGQMHVRMPSWFVLARCVAYAHALSAVARLPKLPLSAVPGTSLSTMELEQRLTGKSVALYFGAAWCPACRNFLPQLNQWYTTCKEADVPVELVFVTSDRSEADFKKHCEAMAGWLFVPFADHATADELKRHCGVWAGVESMRLGVQGRCVTTHGNCVMLPVDGLFRVPRRRSGVPALAVLAQDGTLLHHLNAETEGVRCLAAWDPSKCAPWEFP